MIISLCSVPEVHPLLAPLKLSDDGRERFLRRFVGKKKPFLNTAEVVSRVPGWGPDFMDSTP
jgi:hypothetical protein